jgi:hypothetical protein
MPAGRTIRRSISAPTRKIARTFRLTPGKVEKAQEILGSPTATDAIETALDLVIFREELIRGTRKAFGIQFNRSTRR